MSTPACRQRTVKQNAEEDRLTANEQDRAGQLRLFQEIFEHHEAIEMWIKTSTAGWKPWKPHREPQVAALIQQHAHRAVSECVASGMHRAMRATPLPSGYRE